MKIGNFELENNVFLAPMAGVTDKAARQITKPFGPGLMYTEMVSGKALLYGNEKTHLLLDADRSEQPVAVQLFGHEPDVMSAIAYKAQEAGARIIDINMGCPAPKIVNNGEGSALMKNPELAGRIISAVSAASDVPVTVKIRKGWNEDSVNAVELALIAEENGAAAVCVHGRTREQQYSGKADLEIIKAVKQAVKIPVIGNGDITDGKSALHMLNYTDCDGIMIGRASQGNPWIFREVISYLEKGVICAPPTIEERREVMLCHLGLLVKYKGERRGVLEARKHMAWYLRGLKHGAKLKEAIFSASAYEEMKNLIEMVRDI